MGISMLRQAEYAIAILSRGSHDEEKTKICVCCLNQDTHACPHQREGGKTGPCDHYRLDETDVAQTEERVMKFLQG